MSMQPDEKGKVLALPRNVISLQERLRNKQMEWIGIVCRLFDIADYTCQVSRYFI